MNELRDLVHDPKFRKSIEYVYNYDSQELSLKSERQILVSKLNEAGSKMIKQETYINVIRVIEGAVNVIGNPMLEPVMQYLAGSKLEPFYKFMEFLEKYKIGLTLDIVLTLINKLHRENILSDVVELYESHKEHSKDLLRKSAKCDEIINKMRAFESKIRKLSRMQPDEFIQLFARYEITDDILIYHKAIQMVYKMVEEFFDDYGLPLDLDQLTAGTKLPFTSKSKWMTVQELIKNRFMEKLKTLYGIVKSVATGKGENNEFILYKLKKYIILPLLPPPDGKPFQREGDGWTLASNVFDLYRYLSGIGTSSVGDALLQLAKDLEISDLETPNGLKPVESKMDKTEL